MKNRRVGKFYVTDEMVEEESFVKVLAKIGFVPLRVEHLGVEGRYEYIGISPLFNEAKKGYRISTYDVVVNDLGDDVAVSVKEMD